MKDEDRLSKNKQISITKNATIQRHNNMSCKTFDVKIQWNSLSSKQREALERMFLEQKWYKNYIINWVKQDKNHKIKDFDIKQTLITKKDKDMNDVEVQIQYLPSQSRQCLASRMIANLKTIISLYKKGLIKYGELHYSKKETIIDLKQYGISHKILSINKMKIAGIHKPVRVNGLKQFLNIPDIEIANARLLKRGTGYYVQIVVYVPKENKQAKINEIIGIDFGCQTSLTLSNGKKINIKVPESERLKRLQRIQSKKQKGSKNFYKAVAKVNKEHQKIVNRRNDLANKVIAGLSQYEHIVIQDEQVKSWHSNKHHSKAVQYSILGRVKSKLKMNPNTIILNRFLPTTKLCIHCGKIHNEIKLWDRMFECDCGIKEDRDIHSANSMIWFYKNKIGLGQTDFKPVEIKPLILKAICNQNQVKSMKQEDTTL